MAIPLVKNQDRGIVVRSIINDLVNYVNNTGSVFTPSGSVSVTGSLSVTEKVTAGVFTNAQLITNNITVPAGYNGFLIGPITSSGNITVETSANLIIL